MEETLIKYDTAVLAKDKGFKSGLHADFYIKKQGDTYTEIPVVSQSLLQKWIRSKGIAVDVYSELYCQRFQFKVDMIALFEVTPDNYSLHLPDAYTTYEFALEAGLIEALKLIP